MSETLKPIDEPAVRKVLQQCLANRMSEISEECYCAQWLDNLEYSLFCLMLKGGGEFGQDEVSAEDAVALRCLAKLSDSWIVWDDGEKAMPLAEWIQKYNSAETNIQKSHPSFIPTYCPEDW